jgi:hypothetical protein
LFFNADGGAATPAPQPQDELLQKNRDTLYFFYSTIILFYGQNQGFSHGLPDAADLW